jgi:SAM-dependent MidA family methyltransferase
MTTLPQPSPEQLAHSAALVSVVHDEIAASDGWLPFSRYMELALYAPGLGYYSAGSAKFGAAGDFVTAPEISALFGHTLARQVAQVLRQTGGDVLELGAGTGRLAVQILQELQSENTLPERYCILEVSAYLREVQRETLARELSPELASRVVWLEALPERMVGCVVGNEVLDALPVHVLSYREAGWHERGVGVEAGCFVWRERPASPELVASGERCGMTMGMTSEICPAALALVASLAERLIYGAVLLIDYGFPRHEYYHPQRSQGTLMCHYRHYAHDDPFLYPGLQDITAHVDFTAVAEAALASGLEVSGYATQAQFLINAGITEVLSRIPPQDAARYLPLAAQAQKLLSPAEMGELFKVIALGKGLTKPLAGFSRGDKRHAL